MQWTKFLVIPIGKASALGETYPSDVTHCQTPLTPTRLQRTPKRSLPQDLRQFRSRPQFQRFIAEQRDASAHHHRNRRRKRLPCCRCTALSKATLFLRSATAVPRVQRRGRHLGRLRHHVENDDACEAERRRPTKLRSHHQMAKNWWRVFRRRMLCVSEQTGPRLCTCDRWKPPAMTSSAITGSVRRLRSWIGVKLRAFKFET